MKPFPNNFERDGTERSDHGAPWSRGPVPFRLRVAADGTPVTTVAEATAAIEPWAELTVAGSLETLLGEMQVVDVSDGPTTNSDVALLAPGLGSVPVLGDDGFGWLVPRSGRLWMIEVETGVLLVSAAVLEDSALEDPTLKRDLIELGEAIARTIRLGDG